jgi:hypothetical protein
MKEMFTYRENRVLFVEQGRLSFPCDVIATVQLFPSPVYGDEVPGMTCALNAEARLTWNANTGRMQVESRPPLPRASISAPVGGIALTSDGNIVRAEWQCSSREELMGTLGALHFVLPLCLSVDFPDPAVPDVTSGHAGDATFVWQVEATGGYFETVAPPQRDERLVRALSDVAIVADDQHVRLLAALAYFHRAARLLVAGIGPSEFAGEAVVNLAKCLEALFPAVPQETRNAVRRGLAGLGYESAEIESVFVKALILRSSLDAAHVRLATLTADERRKLQLFMEQVLGHFRRLRRLLRNLMDRARRGDLHLVSYESERAEGDELTRLIDSL